MRIVYILKANRIKEIQYCSVKRETKSTILIDCAFLQINQQLIIVSFFKSISIKLISKNYPLNRKLLNQPFHLCKRILT